VLLGVQKPALRATVQEVTHRTRKAKVGHRQDARAQVVSKPKHVAGISGPTVVGVEEKLRAQAMAAHQRLRLGSILSMHLWHDPLSWCVNRDDYSLIKREIH
jgi:hypothetical protein